MSTKRIAPLLFAASVFLSLSCGSDDESPAGPGDGTHAPADSVPPEVVSFDPDSGATDLHLLRVFTILFSEPMDESSIDSLSVTTLPATPVRTELSTSGDSLAVRPDSIWPVSSDLVLVLAGLADTAENDLDTFRLSVATGPYDSAHLADRFEPNNSTAAATPIEVNRVYPYEDNDFEDEAAAVDTGTIADLSACYLDEDWFSFPALTGQTITLTMDGDAATSIRRMGIFEPGGEQFTTVFLDSTTSTIHLDATADGTAKAMVMIWDGQVTYDLTIRTTEEK